MYVIGVPFHFIIAIFTTSLLVFKYTSIKYYFVQEIVSLSIHYKDFDERTIAFINDFAKGFKKFSFELDVKLVPVGDTEKYYGLPRQLCVLNMEKDRSRQVKFLQCIANWKNPNGTDHTKQCCLKIDRECSEVQKCIDNKDYVTYLTQNKALTESLIPNFSSIGVVFNNVYNETLQEEALKNFVRAACDVFYDKPNVCNLNGDNYENKSTTDSGIIDNLVYGEDDFEYNIIPDFEDYDFVDV